MQYFISKSKSKRSMDSEISAKTYVNSTSWLTSVQQIKPKGLLLVVFFMFFAI